MGKRDAVRPTSLEGHLTRELRREAERSFSQQADVWPEVRRRAQQTSARPSVDRGEEPKRSWWFRRRSGWIAACLALTLVGGAAYAATGLMGMLDATYEETVPYVHEHRLGTPVDSEVSRGGVTVAVDRVYADSSYVAVGYTVRGLENLGDPVQISSDVELQNAGARKAPDYELVDGFWSTLLPTRDDAARGGEAGTVVFEPRRPLEANRQQHFRALVEFTGPAGPVPKNGSFKTERLGRPFVLEFGAPVGPSPVINVDQTVEAGGVPITLTQVVNSPAKTRAYLCFDPPRGTYDSPVVKTRLFREARLADSPVTDEGSETADSGCASYVFDEVLYGDPGTHSLTVERLVPDDPKIAGTIEGPWTFRFDVPGPRLK